MTDPDRLLELLRQTAADAELLRDERNRLIVECREAGVPLRVIAEASGISHPAVIKILDREQ